jgi:DNA-binding transcriptional regulator PaaX
VTVEDVDATETETEAGSADRWLVLVYRIPPEPTRLRATVWRRLKSLGAVYLQNSAAVLPESKTAERALRRLRREILDMQGSAVLLAAGALAGGRDVRALFLSARDDEYAEILDKCQDFHSGLEKEYRAEHFTFGELEENEAELEKLRKWLDKVRARDVFGAPLQAKTAEELEECARALEAYATRVYEVEGEGPA